jgi:cation transport ATPase
MSNDSSQDEHQPENRPRQPAWIVGGALILIGVVFLLRTVTGVELHNWWALFILIPAIGSLVTAWQMFVRNGRRFTAASRGPLIGGLVLLGISAIFLFSIDWAIAWPFILIIAGAGVLLSAVRGTR